MSTRRLTVTQTNIQIFFFSVSQEFKKEIHYPPQFICENGLSYYQQELLKEKKWPELERSHKKAIPEKVFIGLGYVKIHGWGEDNRKVFSFKPLPRGQPGVIRGQNKKIHSAGERIFHSSPGATISS